MVIRAEPSGRKTNMSWAATSTYRSKVTPYDLRCRYITYEKDRTLVLKLNMSAVFEKPVAQVHKHPTPENPHGEVSLSPFRNTSFSCRCWFGESYCFASLQICYHAPLTTSRCCRHFSVTWLDSCQKIAISCLNLVPLAVSEESYICSCKTHTCLSR